MAATQATDVLPRTSRASLHHRTSISQGSAQSRVATPPPRLSSSPSSGPRPSLSPGPHSVRRSLGGPAKQRGCAEPQCTDFYTLLAFALLLSTLARQAVKSQETGDLRRLTHGIDFRGKICGSPKNTSDPDIPNGDFLYWCSQNSEVHFDAPICVSACPTGGEQLLCPAPVEDAKDSRERQANGELLITRVQVQRLARHAAVPTRQFSKLCIPQQLSPQKLFDLIMGAASHGSGMVLRATRMASLVNAPRLMVLLITMAALSCLMYILLLRASVHLFMNALLVSTCTLFVSVGVFLLAKSCSAEVLHRVQSVAAKYGTDILARLSSAAEAHVFDMSPGAHATLGMLFIVIGLWMLPHFCYENWGKMSLAVFTVKKGCTIVFSAPILTLLPLFEITLRVGLFVLACAGGLALLSTAEVHASPVIILGETIAGIPRSFSLTADLAFGLVAYAFAFFWCQALLSATFTYVIARTTALSYFSSTAQEQQGIVATVIAAIFHLGSFAKGSLERTCGQLPRWLGVGSGDNVNAYLDMAITSSPLHIASYNAANLLTGSRLVTATRSMVLWPVMQIYSLAFAMGLGALANMLLLIAQASGRTSQWPSYLFSWSAAVKLNSLLAENAVGVKCFFDKLAAELDALESPASAAIVVAAVSFLMLQSFTMVINRVADAVLYCSLVEQELGTVEDEVPEPIRNMANYQANIEHFTCPISHAIMTDPVMAADNFTYDRSSISQWLDANPGVARSPMTNLPLAHRGLSPNINVRQQIQSFVEG